MEGGKGARWALTAVAFTVPLFFSLLPWLAARYQLLGALIGTMSIYFTLALVMSLVAGRYFKLQ